MASPLMDTEIGHNWIEKNLVFKVKGRTIPASFPPSYMPTKVIFPLGEFFLFIVKYVTQALT
jgi:hypothetical protein